MQPVGPQDFHNHGYIPPKPMPQPGPSYYPYHRYVAPGTYPEMEPVPPPWVKPPSPISTEISTGYSTEVVSVPSLIMAPVPPPWVKPPSPISAEILTGHSTAVVESVPTFSIPARPSSSVSPEPLASVQQGLSEALAPPPLPSTSMTPGHSTSDAPERNQGMTAEKVVLVLQPRAPGRTHAPPGVRHVQPVKDTVIKKQNPAKPEDISKYIRIMKKVPNITKTQLAFRILLALCCFLKIVACILMMAFIVHIKTDGTRLIEWWRLNFRDETDDSDAVIEKLNANLTITVSVLVSLIIFGILEQVVGVLNAWRPNPYFLGFIIITDVIFVILVVIFLSFATILNNEVEQQTQSLDRDRPIYGASALYATLLIMRLQFENKIKVQGEKQQVMRIDAKAGENLFEAFHQKYKCCGLFDHRDWWYTDNITISVNKIVIINLKLGKFVKEWPTDAVIAGCLHRYKQLQFDKSNATSIANYIKQVDVLHLCFTPPSCCRSQPQETEVSKCYDSSKTGVDMYEAYNISKPPYQSFFTGNKSVNIGHTSDVNRSVILLKDIGIFNNISIQLGPNYSPRQLQVIRDLHRNPGQLSHILRGFLIQTKIAAKDKSKIYEEGCIKKAIKQLEYYMHQTMIYTILLGILGIASVCASIGTFYTAGYNKKKLTKKQSPLTAPASEPVSLPALKIQ